VIAVELALINAIKDIDFLEAVIDVASVDNIVLYTKLEHATVMNVKKIYYMKMVIVSENAIKDIYSKVRVVKSVQKDVLNVKSLINNVLVVKIILCLILIINALIHV